MLFALKRKKKKKKWKAAERKAKVFAVTSPNWGLIATRQHLSRTSTHKTNTLSPKILKIINDLHLDFVTMQLFLQEYLEKYAAFSYLKLQLFLPFQFLSYSLYSYQTIA